MRGDGGIVATIIVLPAVVISIWIGIQAALVAHARHVAQAAAQDAAVAGASRSGDPGGVAASLVDESVGGVTSDVGVSVGGGADRVTVTVRADVVSIVPFASFTVSESASAPVEAFTPEPHRP